MQWIISLWIWILVLPRILIVIIPLINRIINVDFLDSFSDILFYLNNLIWSDSVNYLLILVEITMFLIICKWVFKFISNIFK